MKFSDYLKDEILGVLLQLFCAVILTVYLRILSVGQGECILILLAWFVIAVLYFFFRYFRTKSMFDDWENTLCNLDKKYFLGEMLHDNGSFQFHFVIRILKCALKSMTEEVSKAQIERKEYQELIEKWAHELKSPLTAITLNCENNPTEFSRNVLLQAQRIAFNVEQVLYYARLGCAANDSAFKRVRLEDIINTAVLSNKQLLMQNHFTIKSENNEFVICTDEKMLGFILNQIINNCVQYKRNAPSIAFKAYENSHHIHLEIQDNGIGIKESDIGRVFVKGFTGSNGRRLECSTGIGLYLCKELCQQLGIGISIRSAVNEYTCVSLAFQKNPQYNPIQ